MSGEQAITLATVKAMAEELAPRLGLPVPPIVASPDFHLSLAVITRPEGVAVAVSEGHPFLERLDLRAAVAHELFHVLQLSQGFPLVYALEDPFNLAAQIQNVVTDLDVTVRMQETDFGPEAELVTDHRLDGLADFHRTVERYGFLPVITRLPLVSEEVTRCFPQHAARLASVTETVRQACPPEHWRASQEIAEVLGGLRFAPGDSGLFPSVLEAYQRIFLALSPAGRFSIVEPAVFLVVDAGKHLR